MDNARLTVEYFDQHLGTVHSKYWANMLFKVFWEKKRKKERKRKKIDQNLAKKCFFLSSYQN